MNEALVLLLLLWAVLLLPGALRSRRSSPHTTVGGFERAMEVLRARPDVDQGSNGRQVMVPVDAGRIVERDRARHAATTGPDDAPGGASGTGGTATASGTGGTSRGPARGGGEDPIVARRRAWFLRLVIGSAATLVLAVAVGSWMWLAFAVVAGVTAAYTALLRHLKLQHDQARRVVRDLDLPGGSRPAVHGSEPEERMEATATGEVAVGSTVRLRRWDG